MARPTRRPGNLPAETTSFIGRRRELMELRRQLASTRLVTLVGPGGVGKTRLALRIGTDLARGSRDGAWIVELADVTDPALVANAMLAALDLRDQATADPRGVVLAHLREREILLLVDNCEHLLDATAELVAGILRTAPGVRVIATSREPLSVPGEHVIPVPPLELPRADVPESVGQLRSNESVGLFIERAAAASGRFDLTDANRAAVVDLCRRLDGLPLAIELAAVRTRALSVEEIDDRLADRFDLLTRGSRTAQPRHQALRTVLEWSHDLLAPDERIVLRRLCAFAGRFTLADAEAVCSSGDVPAARMLDVLSSLVDKSLVLKEEAPDRACYRLHETTREFAVLKAREAGEEEAIASRCTDHYVSACRRSAPDARYRLIAWLAWMEIEIDNIRAVLRRCLLAGDASRGDDLVVSCSWFWITRATAEGVRWLDAFLALEPGDPDARAGVFFMRGFLGVLQVDPVPARPLLARAAAASAAAGRPGVLVNALSMGAIAANMSGDRESAARLLDEATGVAGGAPDAEAAIAILQARAIDALMRGDPEAVRVASREGARLSREAGDLWSLDVWLMNQAIAGLAERRLDEARLLIAEALPIAHRIDDRVSQTHLLTCSACLAAASGQARLAAQLLGAAATVAAGAGASVMPFVAPLADGARRSAVAALGPARFEAAFDAGRGLDRDAAVRLALGGSIEATAAAGSTEAPDLGALSRREAEVARLVAEGMTNKEIGARLFISEHTV
ncbi:MAG: LuxR C-terminal-related transcriptional regulator, partial [Chloroflexi bacterium]|nr:LuxR C-terminal-related transcriptional regulator [Chloroflexota bacterium]